MRSDYVMGVLYGLYKNKKINKHQYKTYKGQIESGNLDACIVGLQRKKLIGEINEDIR